MSRLIRHAESGRVYHEMRDYSVVADGMLLRIGTLDDNGDEHVCLVAKTSGAKQFRLDRERAIEAIERRIKQHVKPGVFVLPKEEDEHVND